VHGAGAAQLHATAELGSGQPQDIAQIPEQRQVGIAVEGVFHTIDFNLHRVCPSSLVLALFFQKVSVEV
jgi:hypothetical protein